MAETYSPDFSILGNLGKTYQEGKLRRGREESLAALGQGAKIEDVSRSLFQAGDIEGGLSLAKLADAQAMRQHNISRDERDFALRKQEIGRTQSNADRAYSLQEKQFNATLEGGKIPPGFRRSAEGGLEPIPGGPGDPNYKRTVTDRQNAPAGYKWKDANNPDAGLMPIPGGPGEKMDAEVAGRIGLAKSFLGQLDDYTDAEGKPQTGLRKRLKSGETSGPFDAPMAWAGFGGQGEARRILDSGAEALLRNLTGAGMNKDEAAQYVRRYQFSLRDTPTAAVSKLNQLERELRSVIETVGRGRGGAGDVAPPMAGAGAPAAGGDPLAQARKAIQDGAPRDAVIKRLRENNIDPSGL